jgi:hypothetical protein
MYNTIENPDVKMAKELAFQKQLVEEFEGIIKKLIDSGKLRYNPVRNIKYMDKERLIQGIDIFKKELKGGEN